MRVVFVSLTSDAGPPAPTGAILPCWLDRAVWAAYAWPAAEEPANVAEDVILERLLALNQERSGRSAEAAGGAVR